MKTHKTYLEMMPEERSVRDTEVAVNNAMRTLELALNVVCPRDKDDDGTPEFKTYERLYRKVDRWNGRSSKR